MLRNHTELQRLAETCSVHAALALDYQTAIDTAQARKMLNRKHPRPRIRGSQDFFCSRAFKI